MVTANRAEPLTEQQHRDLLRLRAEVGRLRSENSDLEKIREEYSAYRAAQARSARSIESGPATPPPGSLYVRTYFVDADALLSNIGAPAGITNGNSPGYPAQQTAIMQYFKDNDIVLGTNETVFLSDKSGRLIVRSSTENLEKIEALIQDVLQTESTPDRFGLRN